MANWNILKSAIAGIIKTNGNQEITGQLLQNVLNNIVSSVGENATFGGIAIPTTNPGAPDGPVFYLATQAGEYANFNGIKVTEREAVILEWSNGAWSKKTSGFATQEKLTELESQIPLNGIITKGAIISNIQRDAILRQHYINGSSVIKYEKEAFLSDYVGVVADATYEYFGHSQAAATISFFDADKKYISKVNPEVYQQTFTFITPTNCKYIRYGTLSPNLPCYVRYMGDSWYKNPTLDISESFKDELGENKGVGLSQKTASLLYRTICSVLYDKNNALIEDISKVESDKGSYLQSNGNTSYGAPLYGTTHYYLVDGLPKIHYSGFLIPNKVSTAAVCFYDKNKNFISSVYTIISDSSDVENGKYNTEITELDIDVPSNAVFARSCSYQKPLKITTLSNQILNDIAFGQLIKYIDNTKLKFAKNVIGCSDNEVYNKTLSNVIALNSGALQEVEIGEINEGYYIVRDSGKKVPLDTGRYSNPIPVKKGDYIIFVASGAQSGATPMIATISLTDSDGSFYKPMTVKGGEDMSNVYSQCYIEEDGYIALSWISFSPYLTLYKSSSDVLNQVFKAIKELRHNPDEIKFENIDYISKYGFTYFFDKCICIGDSVTHGHIYDYPRTPVNGKVIPSKAYPAYLAKMTGWEVINAGKAGITPKGWWTTMFPNYAYTDYDLAIIELGYNQGLTDTLDVDVEPYEGYANYAETNTGCYCKIIEAIKEANPNILLVLVISSNFSATNEAVVRKIADRYGLPLIDLKDKTYINLSDTKYHGYNSGESTSKDYVHFNFVGYLAKAKFIFNALNYIIDDNAAMVNDLHPQM